MIRQSKQEAIELMAHLFKNDPEVQAKACLLLARQASWKSPDTQVAEMLGSREDLKLIEESFAQGLQSGLAVVQVLITK